MILCTRTRVPFKIATTRGYQTAKLHYEGLGEGGGDQGEERYGYFRKPVWIHVGASTTEVTHLVKRLVDQYM